MGAEQKPAGVDLIGKFPGMPTQGQEYDDKPQEECGVFGIYGPGLPVGDIAYRAGLAQEHRGHSGSGIAFHNPQTGSLVVEKGIGGVDEALSTMKPVAGQTPAEAVNSHLAIFHNRYSTDPTNDIGGVHPHVGSQTGLGVAHNGQFHWDRLEIMAKKYGVDPAGAASESALMANIIDARLSKAEAKQPLTTASLGNTLAGLLAQAEGAYCLTMAYQGKLIAVRDPWGRRPLSIGAMPGNWGTVIASESVTLQDIGVDQSAIRDVEPGEIIIVDEDGPQSFQIPRLANSQFCLYEGVYTAREDGTVFGSPLWTARYMMGQLLAESAPADADMVVGVPKSGLPYAEGYAEVSGIPFVNAILKNPKVGKKRSFQMRGDEQQDTLRDKFMLDENIAPMLEGKNIVIVDDSGIKGNVGRRVVELLRSAGPRQVHIRYGSSRYEKSCRYGMDTSDQSELIARDGRPLDDIADDLKADSVAYNSFEACVAAMDLAKDQAEALTGRVTESILGKFCWSCAGGRYSIAEAQRIKDAWAAEPDAQMLSVA